MSLSLVRRAAAAVALVASTAAGAAAQTSFGANFSFAAGSAVAPGYITFDVLTGGEFRFYTRAGSDPMIHLFSGGIGSLSNGTWLQGDDDACDGDPLGNCPGSSNGLDALFSRSLGVGTYTLAVGEYAFDVGEAVNGSMDVDQAFTPHVDISSATGVAGNFAVTNGLASSTVPEPSTYALMGTGLLGLAAAARRRRPA